MSNKRSDEPLKIELALNDIERNTMSDLQKDMLRDEMKSLPPIYRGEIRIDSIYVFENEDTYEVNVYIRNGLNREVSFDKVPLAIRLENGEILGEQIFDMKDIGILVPNIGISYKLHFKKENIHANMIPQNGWNITFEQGIGSVERVKINLESVPQGLPHDIENKVMERLNEGSLMDKGTFSGEAITINGSVEGDIHILLMFKNASDKAVKLEKMPITVVEPDNTIVSRGVYEVDNIIVGARKAKLFNFVVPVDKVSKKCDDYSKCRLAF